MARLYQWVYCAIGVGCLFISGCASIPTNYPPAIGLQSDQGLKARFYKVDIPTFDGETLRATVYQPKLASDQKAPVVLHYHGFGVHRMVRPISLYGNFIFAGQAAKRAWQEGYWVVSIDHRGHGGSGGTIELMDPAVEVQDLIHVIDWVEDYLPRLAYQDDNILLGMVGESYGGGVQLLGTAVDDRIDAIVPITTWYDFSETLTPNDVVKSGWLTTLIVVGNIINPTTMNKQLNRAYWRALTDTTPDYFAPMLSLRSLSNSCYCRVDASPGADAFFIQGFRDVLFPVNQAIANMQCLEYAGRDVRFLGTQNGHLLPFTQFAWSIPGYDLDTSVTCDGQEFKTEDLVMSWFDEKLKGEKGRADKIPKVCLTHDNHSGSTFETMPRGGDTFTLAPMRVHSQMAGLFELPAKLIDIPLDLFTLKQSKPFDDVSKASEQSITGGRYRPAFQRLQTVIAPSRIAGIPTAQLIVSASEEDIVFIGIGVRRNGRRSITVLNDQMHPLRGGQDYDLALPAISAHLYPGDEIGIVLSGYSNQYRLAGHLSQSVSVHGDIHLPIHAGAE